MSAPTSYISDDVKNSVYKLQTENQIYKMKRMAESYGLYIDSVTDADKAFKNYVVAASAIVDAFSSSADMDSQKETNIQSFADIMKNNETAFNVAITELDKKVSENMVLGTSAVRSYFSSADIS